MKNNFSWLNTAMGHHQAGHFDKAEAAYLRALEQDETNPDALRLLGALYIQTRRPEQAIIALEKALVFLPQSHEIHNNLGIAQSERGAVDEALVHYGRAVALNPAYPQAFYNMGRAKRSRQDKEGALSCFQQAIQIKPDYLDAAVNCGILLAEMGRLDEAALCFEGLLEKNPAHYPSLCNLGNVLRQNGCLDAAVLAYHRALAIKPDYAEAYVNLGTALRDKGDLDGARAAYDKALQLRPRWAEALINLSTLLQFFGDWDGALAACNEALGQKPNHPEALWNKGLILLALGHYDEGWRLYDTGLGQKDKRGAAPNGIPAWDGAPLNGKSLLLWAEQGLGDSLQFIRYARLCKAQGARVTVLCPAPLQRLFAGLDTVDAVITAQNDQHYDVQASLMSLPHLFGTCLDTIPADIPYLRVSPLVRSTWDARIPPAPAGLKIGIVWAGAPRPGQLNAALIDARRSTPIQEWAPLFSVPGTRFFSLQMGEPAAELATLTPPAPIESPMQGVQDFMDTAAIIEKLDLIIAVDTSIVHLAGAMGKPVWILSRRDACWRWLRNQETSPWYPTARIFGQTQSGDWAGVIARVKTALEDWIRNP